jgi:hypothetical protein
MTDIRLYYQPQQDRLASLTSQQDADSSGPTVDSLNMPSLRDASFQTQPHPKFRTFIASPKQFFAQAVQLVQFS